MGACYSVKLRCAFWKGADEARILDDLKDMIFHDKRADYSVDKHEANGLVADSVDNCLKIFLADWPETKVKVQNRGRFRTYANDFKASYGWGSVLNRMFFKLKPYLEEGSRMEAWSDNEFWRLSIKDGEIDCEVKVDASEVCDD